jgi:hypothetical protein
MAQTFGKTFSVNPRADGLLYTADQLGLGATVLALAIDALSPGQTADFGQSPFIQNLDIQWCHHCNYDEDRKVFHYWSKHAQSQGGEWSYHRYDENADTWSQKRPLGSYGIWGHTWGSNALDPATGDFYLHAYSTETVDRISFASGELDYSTSANSFIGANSSPLNGLAWHPNLFGPGDGGLVMGTRKDIRAWRKQFDTWHTTTITGGTYFNNDSSGGALYVPDIDTAFIGSGNEGVLYSIPAGSGGSMSTITKRGPTPEGRKVRGSDWNVSDTLRLVIDPRDTSRLMVLEVLSGERVWTSTDLGDTWTTDATTHGLGDCEPGRAMWHCATVGDAVWGHGDAAAKIWKPA